MADVLTLNYDDGSSHEYSFNHTNIKQIRIEEIEKIDLQELQNGKPIIYKISDYWNLISVTFNLKKKPSIWDDLVTLKDVEEVIKFTMYYRDGTQIDQFNTKIDPNINFNYNNGIRSVQDIEVIFYESGEYVSAMEYDIFPRFI